ncbi:MAG: metal-dependent hydrolase [Candidatus Methanoperedens sp.]|nr:metal-dependent hydrolase [Candidatus Methanoperedens sp.]MCZ7396343.1 metal-dependent hydrolase [Candidatus Methanoperedens sp.]
MDLLSHGLLPYLLGNFFKRRKEEITALILGGIAPDFDVFLLWINYLYPTPYLITHRGLTHSLFFGFFAGMIVLYLASRNRVKTIVRKYVDFEPVINFRTVMFAYAGVIIHLFLDYSTTRGVPFFYPFQASRYSAEVFFYTDIYLTILSLVIIIILYKKPLQTRNTTKFLVVFLLAFAVLGGLRIAEKNSAEQFFRGTNLEAYPTMNPFEWYVLGEDKDKIRIYEYNGLRQSSMYNETVLRMNIVSSGENLDAALDAAGGLPQVWMFKWRAYAVAINASSHDGVWYLDYYDPMQRAMIRGAPSAFFMRINAPIRVKVEAGVAVLLERNAG